MLLQVAVLEVALDKAETSRAKVLVQGVFSTSATSPPLPQERE